MDVSNLLTSTTVLFAILIGFFIAATFTNYFQLQSLLSGETGRLIAIYSLAKSINKTAAEEIGNDIDKYLINTFDYELIDYAQKTWKEFNNIIEAINKIEVRGEKDAILFDNINQAVLDLFKIRQEIILAARKIISPTHWFILTSLASITIFLLYSIRENTLVSSVLTILLSTITFLILFILNDIDNDCFAEKEIGFDVFEQVFPNIGKLKYYPAISIEKRRVAPPKDKSYRLGVYENWPNSFEKEIKIIETK